MNLPPGTTFHLKILACVIETELREAQAFEEALAARLAGRAVSIARSPS